MGNIEREEGYYWCKISNDWYIFTYCLDGVWYDGMENRYDESEFQEIDERRIVRDD